MSTNGQQKDGDVSKDTDVTGTRKYIYTFEGMHEYQGMVLPGIFPQSSIEEARNFNFREDDVVVATYAKAGTAWMQEIVYLVNNEANIAKAKEQPLMDRVPNIDSKFSEVSTATMLSRQQGQRLIKTHLPAYIWEKAIEEGKAKFIVVLRNPKDILVSFYNFYRMNACFGPFTGTWNQFFEMFLNKEISHGDWFDHVLGFWTLRDKPNVLIVQYEDMHLDPFKIIEQVSSFCKKNLSKEQLQTIVDHTTFAKMATNPQTNFKFLADSQFDFSKSKYMRKGVVGDWKNSFTVAQNEVFDRIYDERMKGSGLEMKFVI